MAWFGKKKAQTPPEEENFISHLTELRDRVIRSLLVILILFGACFYVAPALMKFLAQPLQHALPPGSHAVFIAGEGAFFTLTKMSLLAAVLLSLPGGASRARPVRLPRIILFVPVCSGLMNSNTCAS